MSEPLTLRRVLALAWPVMFAQAASAAPGLVDTAVMGRVGTAIDLAAVAVAAVAFSFLYWAFGFLRMATTGLTAQAVGAQAGTEVSALLQRALGLGVLFGGMLWLAFPLFHDLALSGFQASPAVEQEASAYMNARIVGAPAALVGFGISGWLLGTGRTRALLAFQLVLNVSNAALDLILVGVFGLGAAGIGMGTAAAEWISVLVGLWLVRAGFVNVGDQLWVREKLRELFRSNVDILVRTLALLSAFAWFVNAGAQQGDAEAAGNQVLLQFIAVSAFVLDSFAFIAEKETGEAVGASSRERLVCAIRQTSVLAVGSGAIFSLIFFAFGGPLIEFFVSDASARSVALRFLPWCAVIPLVGVPAWQLDGIFLGATRGAALRNAAVVATCLYIGLDLLLRPYGNVGVWWAFSAMYVFRAGALALGLPGLMRSTRGEHVV